MVSRITNYCKKPYGIELATKVVLYHFKNGSTIPAHRDYCGHGFIYSYGYCLNENKTYFQRNETIGIVRVFEHYYEPVKIFSVNSINQHNKASKLFIEWFSKQSDYSMSGFSTNSEDAIFSKDPGNQRINRDDLMELTKKINIDNYRL